LLKPLVGIVVGSPDCVEPVFLDCIGVADYGMLIVELFGSFATVLVMVLNLPVLIGVKIEEIVDLVLPLVIVCILLAGVRVDSVHFVAPLRG